VPPWLDSPWTLPLLAFGGLAIKLLVIGHAISPGSYPPSRVPGLTTVGVLALSAVPFTYLPARARAWSTVVFNAIGTTVALVDLWYFRFYHDVPSVNDIGGLWQVRLVTASLPALIRPVDLIAGADILALIVCMRMLRLDAAAARMSRRSMASALLLGTSMLTVLPVIRIASRDPDEVFEYAFERQQVVGAAGLAGYHVYDLARGVWSPFRGRMAISAEDTSRVSRMVKNRDLQRFSSRLTGSARGQNVIVLSAESLQAFVLGLSIGGQEITPNLNAFASESLRFTRFYDQTHRGTTADAEFIALNSLLPLPFGTVATRYASNRFRALPEVLRERGYRTLSACAEPPSFWNMGDIHPKFGFERSLFAS
jgi:lipoteichoic acid synthase